MEKEDYSIVTRHSEKFKPNKGKTESTEYPGLTDPAGVELAEKTAEEKLKPLIDKLPENAVMAIIGSSDLIRTKSTTRVYGDKLSDLYKNSENTIVKTEEEIADSKKSYSALIKNLQEEMKANPDKKFVFNYPLFIKQFSMVDRWTDKDGNYSPYCNKLLEAVSDNDDQAVLKWVESEGNIDGVEGPKPEKVALEYKEAFERMQDFVEKHAQGRPVYIGGVGHSWDIDVYVALMSHGKVDSESIREIMGEDEKMIKETEPYYFKIDKDRISGQYRGKEYEYELKS